MSQEEYNKNNNAAFTEEESSFDYKSWLFHFLQYWYLFLIAVLLAFGVAAYKNRSWIPAYATSGTILLEGRASGGGGGTAIMQGFGLQSGYRDMQNQVVMMRSYDFLGRVVDSLPFFNVEYITKGRFKTRNIYKHTPIYITPEYVSPMAYGRLFKITVKPTGEYIVLLETEDENEKFEAKGLAGETLHTNLFTMKLERLFNESKDVNMYFCFRERQNLVNEFFGRLRFGYVEEATSIVEISLVSETPERDADFINKLCDVFIAENLALKNDVAVKTIDFIDSQLGVLLKDLRRSEDELTNFRQSNQIIDVSNYVSNIISMANAYDTKKMELDTKEQYLDYLVNYLDENITKGVVMAPPTVAINDEMLISLVQQINSKYLSLSDMPEEHIAYDKLQREIENIKMQVFEAVRGIRLSLHLEKESLEKRMKELNEEIERLPQKQVDMVSIEREYRVNDAYYTFFLQKKAESETQKASNRADNSVLDKARVLYMTNETATQKTTIKYLFIGFLIPFIFVMLLKLLNTKATTISDIEKSSVFPVIGTISRTKKKDPMLLIKKPRSSFAEMFRVIRTRIEFIVQRKSNIMVAISSAESGDGKTYFSANLAAVYAVTQRKTILVDMDIRKPNMHEFFNTSNEPGVTNYLIGEAELKDVIKKTENECYDLLTTGPVPPNPGEIVRSERLKKMFEELRKEYEYIIVDTSPIGLVADAYPISLIADVNLFVTRLNKTHKQGIKKITNQLKDDNLPNMYTIINDVVSEGNRYTKYNSYAYNSYGYGYGYGAKFYSKKKREAAENHARYYTDDKDI